MLVSKPFSGCFSSAQGRNRTADTRIFNLFAPVAEGQGRRADTHARPSRCSAFAAAEATGGRVSKRQALLRRDQRRSAGFGELAREALRSRAADPPQHPCFRCQHEEGIRSWTAHDLVDARRELAGLIERIDARLRELDGRATAGHPSLRVESEAT